MQSPENKIVKVVFWLLIGIFVFILSEFFIPAVRDLFRGTFLFLAPAITFSLVGLILIFLTIRQRVTGKLKKFLILTGAAAAGFFVSVFLHNAFYALWVITNQLALLPYLMEFLHVAFFIIATLVCPLAFLVGGIGSIILFIKEKKEG